MRFEQFHTVVNIIFSKEFIPVKLTISCCTSALKAVENQPWILIIVFTQKHSPIDVL